LEIDDAVPVEQRLELVDLAGLDRTLG